MFKLDLRQYLEKIKTDPDLINQLQETINRVMQNPTTPNMEQKQMNTNIPAHLIMKGILVKEWQRQQHTFACRGTPPKDTNKWTSRVSRFIQEQMFQLWKTRNEHLHRPQNLAQPDQTRIIAQERVRQLYTLANKIETVDREILLPVAMEEKLNDTTPQLQDWVKLMKPSIKRAIENQMKKATKGQSDIRSYFMTTGTNFKHDPPD